MSEQEPSISSLVRDHAGLLASVGLFLMVATKVFRVADADISTAFALIQAGGAFGVTFGVVISCLPPLLYAVGSIGAYWTAQGRRAGIRATGQLVLWTSIGILCFTSGWLFPVALLFIAYALPRIVGWGYRKWGNRSGSKKMTNSLALIAYRFPHFEMLGFLGCALFPLMLTVLEGRPWIPPERISVRDSPVLVGYVISDASGWTAVLDHGSRRIQYLASDTITGREVCRPLNPKIPLSRTVLNRTVWQWLTGKQADPRYETCWRP